MPTSKIIELVGFSNAEYNMDNLIYDMQIIFELQAFNRKDELNDLVSDMIKYSNATFLLAYCRVLYPYRKHLLRWNNLLEKTKKNLSQEGLDAELLTKGLTFNDN